MVILVEWDNNTINFVDISNLKLVKKNGKIEVGARVKMRSETKWNYGRIVMVERLSTQENSSDLVDIEPKKNSSQSTSSSEDIKVDDVSDSKDDEYCIKEASDDDATTSFRNAKSIESEHCRDQKVRPNKRKVAKSLRNSGKEYISTYTKKLVSGRSLGPVCNKAWCSKGQRKCAEFSEEHRQRIFSDFNNLGDIGCQRKFIARFVDKKPKKCNTKSRRVNTIFFYLPLGEERVQVCQKMFINTLGVSDKVVRTAIQKMKETGEVEEEKRGGRTKKMAERDKALRDSIVGHINSFPKVATICDTQENSGGYLNGDLTISKMYKMYVDDLKPDAYKPCFSLYRLVFKSMNLSFYRPKKEESEQCQINWDGTGEEKL